MKAVRPQVAYATERPPLVAGHDALRRVLHHLQPMPASNRHDGIHLARDTRVVHRHDRPGARGNGRFDQALIKIQRILANIHKHRHAAAQHKSIGGGNKGKRRHDNFVARLDIQQQGRHLQGGGTGMGQKRLGTTGPLLKPLVASLGKRPITGQHVAELGLGNVIKLLAGHVGLVERDFRVTQVDLPVCAFNSQIICGTP